MTNEDKPQSASLLDLVGEVVLNATVDAIWVLDEEQRIVHCNTAAEQLFPGQQLLGRRCCEVVHGTPEPIPPCPFRKTQQSLRRESLELPIGSRWFQVVADPILDEAGRFAGAVHVLTEVTERKLGAERLTKVNSLLEDLLRAGALPTKLQRITDGLIAVFQADFARIWLIRVGDRCDAGCMHAAVAEGPHRCHQRDRCLHLAASSGRYTHLDSPAHGRVPFGSYKIGRVAAAEDPGFVTNDVAHDPRVHDHEWARELGLQSFAGYRLLSHDGSPIGVVALFSKHEFSRADEALLQTIAHTASEVILVSTQTEALRESEARFRATLYSIADGVITTDRDGRVEVMNQVAERFTGWREAEARGLASSQVFRILDEDRREPAADPVERALREGEVIGRNHHAIVVSQNGQECPIGYNAAPIRDERKAVVGTALVFRDQRPERLRQRVLRVRLEILEYAASHSLDELLTKALDEIGELVESRIGFYHFVHEDQQKLTLQQWSTATLQEFCKAESKGLHYAIDQAGVWVDAVHQRRPIIHNDYDALPHRRGLPDGHPQVVRELVVPVIQQGQIVAVLGVGNKPTEYTDLDADIVAHLADVTWQAVRHKRGEERLRESEERMQAVLSSTPDYLMLLDREHRVELVNRVSPGVPLEEVLGQPLPQFIDPEHRQRVTDYLDRVIREAVKQQYTTAYCRPDGITHFSSVVAPVVVSGEVVGSVISSRDITEQIRLEQERDQLEIQFRQSQKMEAIGRLAGGIAHDFNNLLTVINSYASMVEQSLPAGDPAKGDLEQIIEAGNRATTLTRQLLAFSRKQVMEPEVLDLNEVVENLERMLRRIIGEHIEFETLLAADLDLISADPSQVEQLLMNMAINARDAMPQGGKLTIETANVELDQEYARTHSDTHAGAHVMMAVTDNGVGMTPEVRERLFEPFFTTKDKGQGTGLGLATVYGIVKQSGGNIWVYSELGKGTTFKVYLPRIEADKSTRRREPTVTDLRGTETVLVVEDERAVRELARRILTAAGYRAIPAANSAEAQFEFERHAGEIDLVLTDVVMPQMSGKDLADHLTERRPGLKVLFMSGYTANAIVHHGVLDKGTQLLDKPFTAADLLRKIRMVLDEDPKKI